MRRTGHLAPALRRTPTAFLAVVATFTGALLLASPAVSATTLPSSLDPGLAVTGTALERVVVTGVAGAAAAVKDAVRSVGGQVRRELRIVDGVSAVVPADRLVELSRTRGVAAVTKDRAARLFSSSFDSGLSDSMYTWTSGATSVWGRANRGAGVGVAVLDTGINRAANDLAGRVASGPDLSGDNAPAVDGYGHGTVMAGIIAGSGSDNGSAPRTGVAPSANVISVKVAGANGVTDVSTVLAAMTWVAAFKDTYNIRVMNLSWGVPSTQSPTIDPLDYGVERLWGLGITVVVAAGNSGPSLGTITKPGDDPLVITVGAYDDGQDTNLGNDVIPQWSSRGPTSSGLIKPDLVAPGRSLIATRSVGSTIETQNPRALVAPSYIRGSGTSQATAVTSGGVALLLAARPTLTPDQVKAALVHTSLPIGFTPVTSQGAGRIQLGSAMNYDVSGVIPQIPVATGLGSLDASRGSAPRVNVSCNGVVTTLNTETTSWCSSWDAGSWTSGSWTAGSWTSGSWTSGSWTGDAWASDAWKSGSWTSGSWTSGSWTGMGWSSGSWTSGSWTSAGYEDSSPSFLTAFWGRHPKFGHHVNGEVSEATPDLAAAVRCLPPDRCP